MFLTIINDMKIRDIYTALVRLNTEYLAKESLERPEGYRAFLKKSQHFRLN